MPLNAFPLTVKYQHKPDTQAANHSKAITALIKRYVCIHFPLKTSQLHPHFHPLANDYFIFLTLSSFFEPDEQL